MEEKVNVEQFQFRGDCGTPLRYEDIVLWRDVVFLRWDCPYSEGEQSGGAPASQTFYYTAYLCERSGSRFILSYFSCVVADGDLPVIQGTGILRDGGVGSQTFAYDEKIMKFWKTGELYAAEQGTASPAGGV